MKKVAKYWIPKEKGIKCLLCPNYCFIQRGKAGICRKRINYDNTLYAYNFAETVSLALDPLEKKPLYHFYPGEKVLSLGANSCNLSCKFCQNYTSSQFDTTTMTITPANLIQYCKVNSIKHVAFTYTEPFTWFEYILEAAKLLKSNDISAILVTNGYVNIEPLAEILPYISAMNIDLKAFSNDFYINYCGGKLQNVLDTISKCVKETHVEVTLLLIESINDKKEELEQLFSFLSGCDPNIPLHISRYFPRYQMSTNTTSKARLLEVVKYANDYLNFVYAGNI
jgi:pyruvate formate lyase activating enzyme